MKKIAIITLSLCAIMMICACGKNSYGMSNKAYESTKKIVAATDQFFNKEISFDEYSEMVNPLILDYDKEDPTEAKLKEISFNMYSSIVLNSINPNDPSQDDLVTMRDELAEQIGVSKFNQ